MRAMQFAGAFAIAAAILAAGALILEAAESWAVTHGATLQVNEHSVCRKVTNNHPSGLALFVPTRTATEWASLYSSPPSGVSIGACGDTLTVKSTTVPLSHYHSCAVNPLTNKIYCFGGIISASEYSNQIYEYDPMSDTVTIKSATLPTGRRTLSCAPNYSTGKIYCFGGSHPGVTYLNQILEYNPATDTIVTKSATLPSGREGLSCATNPLTNKIYCFGGVNFSTYYNQIVEYDPATNTRTTKSATLPTGRVLLSCAANASTGKIYCFGGGQSGTPNHIDQIVEYDPATNVRTIKSATLPTARASLGCATHAPTSKIYCFGGTGSAATQIVEYTPSTDTLAIMGAVIPFVEVPACVPNSGTNTIFCIGGSGSATRIKEYTPN